jgi:hypothetical protein
MTCHKDWFVNYHEKTNGAKIYLGDDRCHEIKGHGDVCVTLPSGHVKQIKNVMYVQIKTGLRKNFNNYIKKILVSTIIDQGLKVEFVKSSCLVKDIHHHYKVIAKGIGVGGLYKLDVTMKDHQALSSTTMST